MTKEEKTLLLQDLCGRLPYKVKGLHREQVHTVISIEPNSINPIIQVDGYDYWFSIEMFKPYLRSMSSMTEDEFGFLQEHLPYDFTRVYSGKFDLINDIHIGNSISIDDMVFLLECFNKWHLDYRGLIPVGLALEAPEGMYK